jgi:hypothetical protein
MRQYHIRCKLGGLPITTYHTSCLQAAIRHLSYKGYIILSIEYY